MTKASKIMKAMEEKSGLVSGRKPDFIIVDNRFDVWDVSVKIGNRTSTMGLSFNDQKSAEEFANLVGKKYKIPVKVV